MHCCQICLEESLVLTRILGCCDHHRSGPRNIASQQEAVLRRKLLEQQEQAADELQRAIELQSRRFVGLQLLDLNSRRAHRLGSSVITSPISPGQTDGGKGSVDGDGNNAVQYLEGVVTAGPVLDLDDMFLAPVRCACVFKAL
jgi:hypothetical protein